MFYTGNDIIEEPDAVVPHVRIWMGAAWATGRSTMTGKIRAMSISRTIIILFGLLHITSAFAAKNCHVRAFESIAQKNSVKIYVIGQLSEKVECKDFELSDYLSKFDLEKIDSLWIYVSKSISLDYELANRNVTKLESSPWIDGLNKRTFRVTLNMWDAKGSTVKSVFNDVCGFPIEELEIISRSSIWENLSIGIFKIEPEREGDACLSYLNILGLLGFEIVNDHEKYKLQIKP